MHKNYPAVITHAQLQSIIDANPFAHWLNIRVESVTDTGIELCIPGRPELIGTQALQRLHGGVVATLLDSGCGYAMIAATGVGISAISLHTEFHQAAPLGILRIVGFIEHLGGRVGCASAKLLNAQGELLASGRSSIYKTQNPHPALTKET